MYWVIASAVIGSPLGVDCLQFLELLHYVHTVIVPIRGATAWGYTNSNSATCRTAVLSFRLG